MKELTEKEALCKAAAYCSASEHCRSEVASKLKAWGMSADEQESILQQLVQERYIDESRYARFYVNDKFRFNQWGRTKIAMSLKQKGIASGTYSEWLDAIPEDDYLAVLRELLQAKQRSVKARNEYELNGKLIRFALGRGYEMSAIRRCLPQADEYPEMD